jgi:hypothetical protein
MGVLICLIALRQKLYFSEDAKPELVDFPENILAVL